MGYEVVGTWRQVLHWGPLAAIASSATITLVTVKCLMIVWPPYDSAAAFLNLLTFVSCVMLIMANFFKAMFRGPGFVPFSWQPDVAEHASSMQFCEVCQGYKVPRSHHCRKCERCVLKMDHHCPWINTCCGHLNHAYFCGFLFFSPVGCIHALCVLVPTIYKSVHFDSYVKSGQTVNLVHLEKPMFLVTMFSIGLSIGATVAMTALISIQLKVILKNETGIETWIIDKARDRRKREAEVPFVYPYNLGWYHNLKQVFPWSGTPQSDGYSWELAEGCHQFALTEEQLKQKAEKQERAVLYLVTDSYSGLLFPCSKGLQVALCIPCADEPRIKLQPGDIVRVTRWKKRWLYGTKLSTVQGKHRIRGWFPRKCAKELSSADKETESKKTS